MHVTELKRPVALFCREVEAERRQDCCDPPAKIGELKDLPHETDPRALPLFLHRIA